MPNPGDYRFTRIPPESTGDRILMRVTYDIPYEGKTGDFILLETLTGVSSGINGTIIRVREDTGTTGVVSLLLSPASEDQIVLPTLGENLQVNAVTIAQVSATNQGYEIYTPVTKLVSYDNPYFGQQVDGEGQAYVRFAEGSPQLDAFGKMRVSRPTIMGEYNFVYGDLGSKFQDLSANSGTVAHDSTSGALVLTCPTTSNALADYGSHLYHHYTPGASQLFECTVVIGDTGKANVTRQWGIFNDNDGAFFQLSNTTFSVVVRSNVSGSPVDTVINQVDFNKDKLDGSGFPDNISQFALDLTNINIFWIDYQWLGAGRIRFGVNINGQRITMHNYYHANNYSTAWARRPSFPVRFRQANSGTSGSSSEMRTWCAGVKTEELFTERLHSTPMNLDLSKSGVTASQTYVASIRPTATFGGVENHISGLLDFFSHSVRDTSSNTDETIKLEILENSTLSGTSYSSVGNGSGLEYDTSGSISVAGTKIATFYLKGTETYVNVEDNFPYQSNGLHNDFDGTQRVWTFAVTKITGTNNLDVDMTIYWREIH